MGLSKHQAGKKFWWIDQDFQCENCSENCLAQESSIRIPGNRIARWCKGCGRIETGQEDTFGYINLSAAISTIERGRTGGCY